MVKIDALCNGNFGMVCKGNFLFSSAKIRIDENAQYLKDNLYYIHEIVRDTSLDISVCLSVSYVYKLM